MVQQVKALLRQSSKIAQSNLEEQLTQHLPSLDIYEKIETLTQCAMLASRHGILSNLAVLIKENPDILKEKQCGIFRITAEIEQLDDFKKITDYLLEGDNRNLIDVNALDCGFLKECIKREKLEYIQYLIEKKHVVFDLQNSNLIKTLLRHENDDILNYFIVELKTPIDNNDINNYMLENNHIEALNKINKCNMFIKLAKRLDNKNTNIKVKKI